eukprot:gene6016-1075_t
MPPHHVPGALLATNPLFSPSASRGYPPRPGPGPATTVAFACWGAIPQGVSPIVDMLTGLPDQQPLHPLVYFLQHDALVQLSSVSVAFRQSYRCLHVPWHRFWFCSLQATEPSCIDLVPCQAHDFQIYLVQSDAVVFGPPQMPADCPQKLASLPFLMTCPSGTGPVPLVQMADLAVAMLCNVPLVPRPTTSTPSGSAACWASRYIPSLLAHSAGATSAEDLFATSSQSPRLQRLFQQGAPWCSLRPGAVIHTAVTHCAAIAGTPPPPEPHLWTSVLCGALGIPLLKPALAPGDGPGAAGQGLAATPDVGPAPPAAPAAACSPGPHSGREGQHMALQRPTAQRLASLPSPLPAQNCPALNGNHPSVPEAPSPPPTALVEGDSADAPHAPFGLACGTPPSNHQAMRLPHTSSCGS